MFVYFIRTNDIKWEPSELEPAIFNLYANMVALGHLYIYIDHGKKITSDTIQEYQDLQMYRRPFEKSI